MRALFIVRVSMGRRILNEVPFVKNTFYIGRASDMDNDVIVNDTTRKVSRRHLVIRNRSGRLEIEDLASANGTFIRGKKIHQAEIQPGEKIEIGDYSLQLFEDPSVVVPARTNMLYAKRIVGSIKATVLHGNSRLEECVFNRDEITIGRNENNTLRILNETVSRNHAVIRKETVGSQTLFAVYDLNSTNGTYWNGKKVRVHELYRQDHIQIGTFSLLIEDVGDAREYREIHDGRHASKSSERRWARSDRTQFIRIEEPESVKLMDVKSKPVPVMDREKYSSRRHIGFSFVGSAVAHAMVIFVFVFLAGGGRETITKSASAYVDVEFATEAEHSPVQPPERIFPPPEEKPEKALEPVLEPPIQIPAPEIVPPEDDPLEAVEEIKREIQPEVQKPRSEQPPPVVARQVQFKPLMTPPPVVRSQVRVPKIDPDDPYKLSEEFVVDEDGQPIKGDNSPHESSRRKLISFLEGLGLSDVYTKHVRRGFRYDDRLIFQVSATKDGKITGLKLLTMTGNKEFEREITEQILKSTVQGGLDVDVNDQKLRLYLRIVED